MNSGLIKFDINVSSLICSFAPHYFLPLTFLPSNRTAGCFLNVRSRRFFALLFPLLAHSAPPSQPEARRLSGTDCPPPRSVRCPPCVLFFHLPLCAINDPMLPPSLCTIPFYRPLSCTLWFSLLKEIWFSRSTCALLHLELYTLLFLHCLHCALFLNMQFLLFLKMGPWEGFPGRFC